MVSRPRSIGKSGEFTEKLGVLLGPFIKIRSGRHELFGQRLTQIGQPVLPAPDINPFTVAAMCRRLQVSSELSGPDQSQIKPKQVRRHLGQQNLGTEIVSLAGRHLDVVESEVLIDHQIAGQRYTLVKARLTAGSDIR